MIRNIFNALQQIPHRLTKGVLWMLSIIFIVMMIIQASFWAGALWLKSDNGKMWLRDMVASGTSGSGYQVTFDRISYAFPQSIQITNINISDDQGTIADANRLVVRPHILGLTRRQIGLSTDFDTLNLYRLPEDAGKDKDPQDSLTIEPFSLPGLYFTRFDLSSMEVETLHIHPGVFGLDLVLSPRFSAQVALDDVIELHANLSFKNTQTLPMWMPYEATIQGTFDNKSLVLTLDEITAVNDIANIKVTGTSSLTDSIVNLDMVAKVDNLSNISPDIAGTFDLEAMLKGDINNPSLNGSGILSMPMLAANELNDIQIAFKNNAILEGGLGSLSLMTTYQDQPVSLSSDLTLDGERLEFNNLRGAAPATTLSGDMAMNIDTLVVTGNGIVAVTDMNQYQSITDVNISGNGRAEFNMLDNDGTQAIKVNATLNDIIYDAMSLNRAIITATIPNIMQYWPTDITISALGFRPSKSATLNTINATLKQASISGRQVDDYVLTLNMAGTAQQDFNVRGSADINGIRALSPKAQNINLTLSSNGSTIMATGAVDQSQIDMALRTNNFALDSFPLTLPTQFKSITMDAKASVKGAMAQPQITATTTLSPLTTEGAFLRLSMDATYADNLAKITMTGRGDGINNLSGNAEIPLTLTLNPFVFDLPMDTNIQGALSMNANMDDMSSIILPVGHNLTGNMQANADVGGTLKSLDMNGYARLTDGSYNFDAYGVNLYDLNIQADLSQNILRIQNLNATDGESGKLSGQGRIGFTDNGRIDLHLKLSDFYLLDSDTIDGHLSADMRFKGREDNSVLSGDITLGEVNVRIPERFVSDIPTLNIVNTQNDDVGQSLNNIALDISVQASNRIFVRGWGLDAEFGGDLDIAGTLDDPQLNGVFESRRGRYEEFGRRFELEQAYLRFQGSMPPSPYLDIIATTDADNIEASVNLTGSIESPEILLTSTPSLPQDEVMSKVLFGENVQNISPFQAIQLKQTLDRFTGRGGNGLNPLGALRNATGLDDIRVDTDDEGQTEVGVGKYLSEEVYLELEKGAGGDSGTAKIQVEVTPNINVESEIGQDAEAGAGIFWKWDY